MGDLKQWDQVVDEFLGEVNELHGLSAELRILRDLKKLASQRHRLRGITESLGHGLLELKTSHDGMEYRCIYVHHHPDIVILACFNKKTAKTPKQQIEIARSRHAILLAEEIALGDIILH
jgi:phage-related protein